MAAAKAARRNAYVSHFCVPNDPFHDINIGRRTGIPLNITARKHPDGFENIDDYFPDSDAEEGDATSQVNVKCTENNVHIGRRTGLPMKINARVASGGFENIDDYFPDSASECSREESALPADNEEIGHQCGTDKNKQRVEDIDKESQATRDQQEKPEEPDESPNNTGTAVKNTASREPTPEFRGTKKRLIFTAGRTPADQLVQNEQLQRVSPVEDLNEKVGHNNTDIEVDVVGVDDTSKGNVEEMAEGDNSDVEIDVVGGISAAKPNAHVRIQTRVTDQTQKKERRKQGHADQVHYEDDCIDVAGTEEEDTFVTIGNTSQHKGVVGGKSPLSGKGDSFIMSESYVLEGTKHKTMSPEFVFDNHANDLHLSSPEEVVSDRLRRRKNLASTKQVQEKSARRKQRKDEDEINTQLDVGLVDGHDNKENEGRIEEKKFQNAGKKKATRRRQQKSEEQMDAQPGSERESNDKDEQNLRKKMGKSRRQKERSDGGQGDTQNHEKGEDRGCRVSQRLRNTRRQMTEQENEDRAVDDVGNGDGGKGKNLRNGKEQQKRPPRGRKTKGVEPVSIHSEVRGDSDIAGKEINEEDKGRQQARSSKRHNTKEISAAVDEGKEEPKEDRGRSNVQAVNVRRTRAQRKREEADERDDHVVDKDRLLGVYGVDLAVQNQGDSDNLAASGDDENTREQSLARGSKKADPYRQRGRRTAKLKDATDGGNGEYDPQATKNTRTGGKSKFDGRDQPIADLETQARGKTRGRKSNARRNHTQKKDEGDSGTASEGNEQQDQLSTTVSEVGRNASEGEGSVTSGNASSSAESGKGTSKGERAKKKKRASVLPPYMVNRTRAKSKSSKEENHEDTKRRRMDEEQDDSVEVSVNEGGGPSLRNGSEESHAVDRHGKASAGRKRTARESVSKKSSGHDENYADIDGEKEGSMAPLDHGIQSCSPASNTGHTSKTMVPTPFPGYLQSRSGLRSILKSGGSAGRRSSVPKKRKATSEKSQSGGSDADDESGLPAKQRDKKRLSTVSFAATPVVCTSDEDASKGSPARRSLVSLSFVSKNTSNRSTDGTFTPGSGPSVRSSVGHASGSSELDSSVDLSEELTVVENVEQLEDATDLQTSRRSKRTIVPPLQYWKNERLDYERRKSGGWLIKGVIRNPTPVQKKKKKTRKQKPKQLTRTKESDVNTGDSSDEGFDYAELNGFEEVVNPTAVAVNPENNEEVNMDLFHTCGMLNFTTPFGAPAHDDDPMLVHKFISQPLFGSGQVIIRPGAEKGKQYVRKDTMVFYVIKGRVLVTVHQSSAVLNTGSTFFVPQGNSYNIKNPTKTDAKLLFVQIKG